MAGVKLVGFGLVLLFALISNINAVKYHVPVLVWGSGESNRDNGVSSLTRLHSNDYLDYFMKRVHTKKPPIVIFAENTLSVEDFSHQLETENFPNLKDLSKSEKGFEFLPSVEQPISALTGPEIQSYGYSSAELSDEPLQKGKVYVVKLDDAESKEDRSEMLHRHDSKVAKMYRKFAQQNPDVVAVFTAHFSSWFEPAEVTRVRRATNGSNSGVVLRSGKTLIYSPTAPVLKIGDKEELLVNPQNFPDDDRENYLKAIYSYTGVKLRFYFTNSSSPDSWELREVEYETPSSDNSVLLQPNQFIGASLGHSYHVSGPVSFFNKTYSLTFDKGLQVEAWLNENQSQFSYAEESTPFFTAPIWMGIFVMTLLGMIMIWALTMILEIRTMDQFDDPKGKTITVNVTD